MIALHSSYFADAVLLQLIGWQYLITMKFTTSNDILFNDILFNDILFPPWI